ncbi:MAG TPA: ribonuclease III [Pyrinomonadaceae bacterium]|jgi:ribonuclease-3|nr:ribonuclease III [Pyrinomonadaceae bacterium]
MDEDVDGVREGEESAGAAPELSALEESLGYSFRDRELLERALTHRSWAYESVGAGEEQRARLLHNEVLEFVGDSVLGLVVAHTLFSTYTEANEGDLSRMKHVLVNTRTLSAAAQRLRIGEHMRVGRGEEKAGGRLKKGLLEDAFEAVVAAVFLDGGFDAAAGFVTRALGEELAEVTPESVTAAAADHKTVLQERLQADLHLMPHYEVVDTEGPPHARTFHVEAVWDATRVRGRGRTIKAAEMDAACHALELLDGAAGDEVAASEDEGAVSN